MRVGDAWSARYPFQYSCLESSFLRQACSSRVTWHRTPGQRHCGARARQGGHTPRGCHLLPHQGGPTCPEGRLGVSLATGAPGLHSQAYCSLRAPHPAEQAGSLQPEARLEQLGCASRECERTCEGQSARRAAYSSSSPPSEAASSPALGALVWGACAGASSLALRFLDAAGSTCACFAWRKAPMAARTACSSFGSVHLPCPLERLEWMSSSSAPRSRTSKFPVVPGSRSG